MVCTCCITNHATSLGSETEIRGYDPVMASESVLSAGVRSVTVRRRGKRLERDLVVVEEPLEIRLDGKPLVVTMRTPGYDEELAAGFLYAEGVITGRRDVATMRAVAGTAAVSETQIKVTNFAGDRVEVTTTSGLATDASPTAERAFRATAACGVCGKESIDQLDRLADALPAVVPVECSSDLLETLPAQLRDAQELFDATGGIHAAGVFSLDGALLCLREDIGRHNAVDKVIGHFVMQDAVPLRDRILVVSGRAGFELVQKALKAAIPAMVSVGAASSIAVEMATAARMTLYSFAGRGRGNLHVSHPRP